MKTVEEQIKSFEDIVNSSTSDWHKTHWVGGHGLELTKRVLHGLGDNNLQVTQFWPKGSHLKVRIATPFDVNNIDGRVDIFRIFDKISGTETWSKTSFSTR